MEYLNFWAGEIALIHHKIAWLFALLRIVKINHYSIPALILLKVVQHKASLNQKTTLHQSSQIPLSL
jgi:hypothetical protein